ncbi:ATP-dependent helicase HrpB [Xanthomonas translucens]|uniref:ATP-dependent helicase HrpB n=9 Tax=Xanthomonas campestris pv. translucens TaxID=343 RepID=UPI00071BDAFB|nr:ATP-dependent helicase HrpB [Xanthomonas translucens]MCT8283846.1 ATP-dependent helicase HrpB [Xanthomonas translucens pv. undulosa]MCT8318664.1 ATP-dependent helicase HrpB [Xanthomonas translucens pv. undulosa]WLA16263.1 ATP-dependent helicase HrpB [Xanthomonas translucens]
MASPVFPIDPLLPQIRDSLAAHPRLVLEAPPGAGKTTQVPPALLEAPWLQGRRIVMLEPRRVAARSAATFMARQRGEAPGETVGYRIRFENKVSARTRIEVVTEGILTRMLQDDPMLDGVGALLFDEFHERHLAADLGLALALDVQAQVREDLRIVVMSATLDGERLAQFLDAPRLSSAGRSYPVEIAHFPARREEALEAQTRRAIEHALQQHPGDVLVFLPGQREIARVQAALEAAGVGLCVASSGTASGVLSSGTASVAPSSGAARHLLPGGEGSGGVDVLPLHGELPVEQQAKVLQPDPHGRRRVVLATNVAESSVTLPGVRVVIDAGLAREPHYDPNSGFSRLDVTAIAQASADQRAGRAGRAGRVASGWAYRLWPQSQRLEAQRRAEMLQVELAGLALELAAWGSDALRFVDPPPVGALAAARELLQRLGALSENHAITASGRHMLALGTHPRLAAMLLAAPDARAQALACDLAALVEARDPLRQGGDALAARWRALAGFRRGRVPHDANRGGLAAIDAAAKQWRRRLRSDAAPPDSVEAHELGDLLAHAFPDRIATRHPADPLRYLLANGRSARLFDNSDLRGEPWLVATELRYEAKDALLLRAAPVDEARLRADFPQRFVQQDVVRWDAERRALSALRETRFDRIVLDSHPAGRVDPAHAAAALTEAVRELGLQALPWSEPMSQWRARVVALRTWMPELGLPDLGDAALLEGLDGWLRPAFAGKTRLDALGEDDLGEALKSLLPWDQRQAVERHAPTRITVPSGMERRIDYALDHAGQPQPPVLGVKLQELFGLADTPRVADGRVPLLLHLLSPGGRPLQVTQDLRNFWSSTYPEVKKEMKGRYPRHPWPDDPWTATASHRAKPRGT